MAFVSLLSIGLLTSFASMISTLKTTYNSFLAHHGDVDLQVSFSTPHVQSIFEPLLTYDDTKVDKIDQRFALDMYLEKNNGRKITARLFSFDEEHDQIFARRIKSKTEKTTEEGYFNVSVASKFATNNNFKLGSTFKVGMLGIYINCFVNEIVETPEGIYPRSNDYIWSDNHDFGYIYVDINELADALGVLGNKITDKCNPESPNYDPDFLKEYQALINEIGGMFPDLREITKDLVPTLTNQLLIKAKPGVSQKKLSKYIEAFFDENIIAAKSITLGKNLPYQVYMDNALSQLKVATTFLPIFFYAITMIVIGLFMNQIIKTMTSEIGVLISIGVDKKHIMLLYMMFSLVMGLIAGGIGIGVGYGLNALLTANIRVTYSMSFIPVALNPLITVLGVFALIIFAELATFISCLTIFKITPKDALIANESKRKPLPKWLQKMIDKSPMNIKLATNSIAQNPKRFFVSTFSIFASYVLILLSCFFFVSKNEMVNQTVNKRLNYDCQIYLPGTDEELAPKLRTYTETVKKVDDCFYTYVSTTSSLVKNNIYVECLGLENINDNMVNIPDSSGKGSIKIKETGIILPTTAAKELRVSKGDTIKVGENEIVVTDVSYQYFHPVAYLSKAELSRITNTYVTSLLVDVRGSDTAFLDTLASLNDQCLTVFTKSLKQDLLSIFNSINIFLVILIVFSLGMAFVILSIMSQNALLESKRQLSVFRAIGFTIGNVSNIWTFTSFLQLLGGSILAIPAGVGVSLLLFSLASSSTQIYPFIFDWKVVVFGFAFVFLVVLACHLISMFNIKKWNLADNLRCRE